MMIAFQKTYKHSLTSLGFALLLTFCPSHARAAERLTLQIGPLQESISIQDLEQFARTGELSPTLKPYHFLLSSQLQEMLLKRFHIDPIIASEFLDQLFNSSEGKKLLEQIKTMLPDTDVEQIKLSLREALEQPDDLNILSFLRVYPAQDVRINLVAMGDIASQFGAANLQSKFLTPRLAQDLERTPKPSISYPFDPTLPGLENVYKEALILRDKTRNRSLAVDIYYSFHAQGPLVVMSHGFAADRRFLKYLAYHLASYGLTVVSVEHPGSNIHSINQISQGVNLNEILPASEFIERPKDISFVLDELAEINQNHPYLQGKINTQKVTLIGHSFGGYTALAVAGAQFNPQELRTFCEQLTPLGRSPADWFQCAASELPYSQVNFRDPRVVQVMAFNPIVGNLFEKNLEQVKIPTLILASSEDGITPNLAHQLRPFQHLQGEKYLLVAVGATHMSVTDISYLNSALGQSTLVREIMDERANPVRNVIKGVSLAFIEQMTPEKNQYKPFLTPTYVQSLSSSQIALRLTQKLPMTVETSLNVLSLSYQKVTLHSPKSKDSLLTKARGYLANLKEFFSSPEYSTGQLEEIFGGLIKNYQAHSDKLS